MRLGTRMSQLLGGLRGGGTGSTVELGSQVAAAIGDPRGVTVRQQELIDQVLSNPILGGHSLRTAVLSVGIARRLGMTSSIGEVFLGGLLHDVGQLFLPQDLLVAPRSLTSSERKEHIEAHPVLGALVLEDAGVTRAVLDCVLHHHERWDGGGYPYGLAGSRIPISARIVAVAEIYDTLSHDQAYQRAFSREDTLDVVCLAAGSQLDPEVAVIAADMLRARQGRGATIDLPGLEVAIGWDRPRRGGVTDRAVAPT
jgi:HD-GYP domain-containing protein (c-di-GMP phosphodiesterase class II)